jgi:phosphatidylglycerol:prolipoprotein diacylglycerol transferase
MSTGFQIGPIFIHYYGIILMMGAVAAAWLADWSARRRGLKSDMVWDALIWVLIGGIIGARLWHIFTPPPSMLIDGSNPYFYEIQEHVWDNLWAMINTRRGGLGIPGAVIGGMLALYFFCRRKKVSFLMWADIAVPALALGQAIGRWGNYINQELYGKPTDLPWAITINPLYRVEGYEQYATFHPLFLYESLWNLFLMGLLLWLDIKHSDKLKEGDLLLIYLIGYPLGRFMLEFLRLDAPMVGTLNTNQTVMAVVAVAAAVALVWRHRKQPASSEPVV